MKFQLPVCPPANNAWINSRVGRGRYGRIKSRSYREWLRSADAWFMAQPLQRKKISGEFGCKLTFYERLRGDPDGRIKLLLDWLVSREFVDDDKYLRKLTLALAKDIPWGMVQIEVWPHVDDQNGEPGSRSA